MKIVMYRGIKKKQNKNNQVNKILKSNQRF